jgi:ribosome-associated heat shock protein Hsp15
MSAMDGSSSPVRVDKWLWAARFFKTRGLAAEAVKGGRVHVNGRAAKPSKDVAVGDELEITVGENRFHVQVRGTAERRGSAAVAAQLYEETPESRAERERRAAERRLEAAADPFGPQRAGRPTKRDRRRLEDVMGGRRRRGGPPIG